MSEEFDILIQGHLDKEWEEWFEGFNLMHMEDGTTLLRGKVADQPALHGLLLRISQLGWTLLKVERRRSDAA